MIEGILFDMDGVLIDSEPIILHAAQAFFKRRGIDTKAEDFRPFVGAGDRRYLCGVGALYGLDIDFDVAVVELYELYEEFAKEASSFEGVHRFLSDAKRSGLKVAVATGSERRKALVNLAAIGLTEDDFDVVISGEQVIKSKPEPDIYQLAALTLGLPLSSCLVVEDALHGVVSANRAGATVLALPNSFNKEALKKAGSHVVLDTLADFGAFDSKEEFNRLLNAAIQSMGILYGTQRIAVEKLTEEQRTSLFEKAVAAAYASRNNAYAPYSHFKVGAALVSGGSLAVYSGCNVENSSYGATICAERNAALHAVASEGEVGFEMLVVVSDDSPPAPPCALCLQVLAEFCRPETEVHLVDTSYAEGKGGAHITLRFSELLPHPFIFPSMRQS